MWKTWCEVFLSRWLSHSLALSYTHTHTHKIRLCDHESLTSTLLTWQEMTVTFRIKITQRQSKIFTISVIRQQYLMYYIWLLFFIKHGIQIQSGRQPVQYYIIELEVLVRNSCCKCCISDGPKLNNHIVTGQVQILHFSFNPNLQLVCVSVQHHLWSIIQAQ